MPTVAIAASSFAPHKGGVEELVRQLAHQQRADGSSPSVLTMRWPKDLPRSEVFEGIPVRRFLYRAPEGDAFHRGLAYATMPTTIFGVARHLRRSQAELVHIQCVSSAAWFVARAARLARLPLVVTMQGELTMDATQVYERSAFLRSTLRQLLASADAVTACSRATLEEAQAWADLELGERGSVVYNGVRVSDFRSAAPMERARPYVFAVGRHVREKGFDVLIDAFGRLSGDATFGWDLVLAGDGPEHRALEAQVERLGLGGRVQLVGATDRPTTASWFRGASAFVLPSRHEPFGIVNLEAMAAGVPVVATAVGGVPEFVIDGDVGLLVAPEAPESMAAAIRRIHDDPELACRLARSGRRHVEQFDWGRIAGDYHSVYEKALAHRG